MDASNLTTSDAYRLGGALSFAWSDANILGSLGVRKSPCGCERRFGRPLLFCGPHAGWDD